MLQDRQVGVEVSARGLWAVGFAPYHAATRETGDRGVARLGGTPDRAREVSPAPPVGVLAGWERLPARGLVEVVLRLRLGQGIEARSLDIVVPFGWGSTRGDRGWERRLTDVLENAHDDTRVGDGRSRHPRQPLHALLYLLHPCSRASRGISTSLYVKAMMRMGWPQRVQTRGKDS